MTTPNIPLLKYDSQGVFHAETGLAPSDIQDIAPALEAARTEVVETDMALFAAGNSPAEKEPLDAGFFDMPENILKAYHDNRPESELHCILEATTAMSDLVDRTVVLGIGGSYMGARALMESCCHPYFNELSRADRGSRPRMYFEGNNVDNDASQGLLDLLGQGGKTHDVEDRWGIVVISKSGGTLETAAAFRQFLDALSKSCGGDAAKTAERIIPVTGSVGKLHELAGALGCRDVFNVPDGVGGRFSILSPVGLVPAALLGLDVVRLLQGAAAMNEHFRTAPFEENVVLQYVAVCHQLEKLRGANTRILSAWSKGLESAGLWYDQLLAESLGKEEKGALPLTVLNTRDLHSRGQQHQEGVRDKLVTNLIVDTWRRSPLAIGTSENNQDQLNELADKTLPDVMAAAIEGTNKAYNDVGRPTADLHLPQLDEASMGQLFQMLMIATVVEGRLIGINPYGQPGVEDYKRNMNAILRS